MKRGIKERKEGGKGWRNKGKEVYRKGGIRDWRDRKEYSYKRKEGFGKEGYRKGSIREASLKITNAPMW